MVSVPCSILMTSVAKPGSPGPPRVLARPVADAAGCYLLIGPFALVVIKYQHIC